MKRVLRKMKRKLRRVADEMCFCLDGRFEGRRSYCVQRRLVVDRRGEGDQKVAMGGRLLQEHMWVLEEEVKSEGV